MSIASVTYFFAGLKHFQHIWTIAELSDIGWGGGGSDSGRNGRHPGEPISVWPELTPSANGLVCTPPTNDGHPTPGGDLRSASYPVDDVHQAGSHGALEDGP